MKAIIATILTFAIVSPVVRAAEEQLDEVSIQVAGFVREPKRLKISKSKTVGQFLNEAQKTEFATAMRLVVIRHGWQYSESGSSSDTTTRTIRTHPDDLVSSLNLNDGDIVVVLQKPPVGR